MRYLDQAPRRSGKTTRLANIVQNVMKQYENIRVFGVTTDSEIITPNKKIYMLPSNPIEAFDYISDRVRGVYPYKTLVVIDDCPSEIAKWLLDDKQHFNILNYHYAISVTVGFWYFYFTPEFKVEIEHCEFSIADYKTYGSDNDYINEALELNRIYSTKELAESAVGELIRNNFSSYMRA